MDQGRTLEDAGCAPNTAPEEAGCPPKMLCTLGKPPPGAPAAGAVEKLKELAAPPAQLHMLSVSCRMARAGSSTGRAGSVGTSSSLHQAGRSLTLCETEHSNSTSSDGTARFTPRIFIRRSPRRPFGDYAQANAVLQDAMHDMSAISTRLYNAAPVLKEKVLLAGAGALSAGFAAAGPPPPKADAKPFDPAHANAVTRPGAP